MVVQMGREFGGNSYNFPSGHIYPNTEWHVHVCSPADVDHRRAEFAKRDVLDKLPGAQAVRTDTQGWLVMAGGNCIAGGQQDWFTSEDGAWLAARRKLCGEG